MTRTLAIALSVAVLSVGMVGCGDDAAPAAGNAAVSAGPQASTSTSPTPKPRSTPDANVVAISIAVDGRSVDPAPSRTKVPVGATVTLTVRSDVANEIHVHGYEIFKDVAPGKPAVITFEADQPGLFEIETHEAPELILGQLQVQ